MTTDKDWAEKSERESLLLDAEYQRERAAILATAVGLARLYLAEHRPEAAKEALDTAARQSRELLERLLPLFDTDRLVLPEESQDV